MKKQITALKKWNCDIDAALERLSDDEEFYIECLQDIVNDRYFEVLKEALENKDNEKAFNAAHTLKGVFSNVGLTPMYNKVVEIVEPLRNGNREGMLKKYAQLLKMREHLRKILLYK